MSQENVEIVRQSFERFARGDFTESADLPDDVVVVTAPEMPDAGTYRGEGAREWLTAWVDSFESLTLDPVEILDAGDSVMVEFIQRGTPKGGSTPVELRTWSVSTRHEGVLTRFALFQSRAEALEAAGLVALAMSEKNVELAHSAADAFNRRDLNALLALIDTDVEFVPLHTEMEGGDSYKGHEGVRIWWEDLLSVFQDFRVEVVEVTVVGNVTVTRLCISGQGTDSKAPIEQTNWQATEWHNRKAVWWRTFRSEAEAFEAAGLRE